MAPNSEINPLDRDNSAVASNLWSIPYCSLRSLIMFPSSFLPSIHAQSSKVNPADGSPEITKKSVPRKPIKSAIRNSRTHETTTSQNHQPSNCIPYMPSTSSTVKGCAPTNNKNGYISPQWGW